MAIKDRTAVVAGVTLVGRYKGDEHRAEVLAGDEGKIKVRLADAREFKSLSAAGTVIMGCAVNGWVWWSIAEPEALAAGPSKPRASAKKAS